jgi:hypothetical protein
MAVFCVCCLSVDAESPAAAAGLLDVAVEKTAAASTRAVPTLSLGARHPALLSQRSEQKVAGAPGGIDCDSSQWDSRGKAT